jgi:hypothetical protein
MLDFTPKWLSRTRLNDDVMPGKSWGVTSKHRRTFSLTSTHHGLTQAKHRLRVVATYQSLARERFCQQPWCNCCLYGKISARALFQYCPSRCFEHSKHPSGDVTSSHFEDTVYIFAKSILNDFWSTRAISTQKRLA